MEERITGPTGSPDWWETLDVFGSSFGVTDSGTAGLSIGGTRGFVCRRVQNLTVYIQNPWLGQTLYPTCKALRLAILDTFTSTVDIEIDEIMIDLSPMLARRYTASQLKKTQVVWWYFFNYVTCESVRAMIHGAGSSSKAWRCLNKHFPPLSDS